MTESVEATELGSDCAVPFFARRLLLSVCLKEFADLIWNANPNFNGSVTGPSAGRRLRGPPPPSFPLRGDRGAAAAVVVHVGRIATPAKVEYRFIMYKWSRDRTIYFMFGIQIWCQDYGMVSGFPMQVRMVLSIFPNINY